MRIPARWSTTWWCWASTFPVVLASLSPFQSLQFACQSIENIPGRPEMMQECLDSWSNLGLDYEAKYWEKSAHAAHLIHHREEYLSTFNSFYEKASKWFEINHIYQKNNSFCHKTCKNQSKSYWSLNQTKLCYFFPDSVVFWWHGQSRSVPLNPSFLPSPITSNSNA